MCQLYSNNNNHLKKSIASGLRKPIMKNTMEWAGTPPLWQGNPGNSNLSLDDSDFFSAEIKALEIF